MLHIILLSNNFGYMRVYCVLVGASNFLKLFDGDMVSCQVSIFIYSPMYAGFTQPTSSIKIAFIFPKLYKYI